MPQHETWLRHDDAIEKRIGARVKEARLNKKLTQAELAEAIDKAFETISNIERGKTYPNFQTLWDISLIVGVPLRDFFDADVSAGGETTGERQSMLLKLHHLAGALDDDDLSLWQKLVETILNERQDKS